MQFKKLLFVFALIVSCFQAAAQKFNPKIDKDSLFNMLVENVHPEKKKELTETYFEGDDNTKEFLLMMLNFPRSSKADMIANLEKKKEQIFLLRSEYEKLVPEGYSVFIEFNPADSIFQMPENIDLHIYGKTGAEQPGGWNLEYGSEDLTEALTHIKWNSDILQIIKKLLDNAGCISIQNGIQTQVGFARSGMGKYSYRIFNETLSSHEVEKYNDGCTFIYYKDNIVLEYGGGAVGPQCFPD